MAVADIVDRLAAQGWSVSATDAALTAFGAQSGDANAQRTGEARHVTVDVAPSGSEVAGIAALAETIGESGVGVLVLSLALPALPLGPVLAELGRQGLYLVAVELLARRRQYPVALVVTHDSEFPQEGYLAGEPVGADERAMRRRRNEWLLEGVAHRATIEQLQRDLVEAQQTIATLRAERDQARAQGAKDAAAAAAYRRVQQLPEAKIRRAAQLIAAEPLSGSARVARAAARRAKGRLSPRGGGSR